MGVPWGTPMSTRWVPTWSAGWGTYPPYQLDGVPPNISWIGVPPPKYEQTDTYENSTLLRTRAVIIYSIGLFATLLPVEIMIFIVGFVRKLIGHEAVFGIRFWKWSVKVVYWTITFHTYCKKMNLLIKKNQKFTLSILCKKKTKLA